MSERYWSTALQRWVIPGESWIWHPIETAPQNERVIVYSEAADDMAMGWHDRIDGQWYHAPQGGLIPWTPSHWMSPPERPKDTHGNR